MDWKDRIVLDPAILSGKPVVKGTRLAVEFIIDLGRRAGRAKRSRRDDVSALPPGNSRPGDRLVD